MKFVIDQQLPPAMVSWLSERGHEAKHVRMLGLREARDAEIWDLAVAQGLIVITKDEDFALRRGQSADGPQIVWLRVGNTTRQVLLDRLNATWLEIEATLSEGASIVEVL